MAITRLSNAEWVPGRYTFGKMEPTGILVHGTVSGLKKYSCRKYLLNSRENALKSRRYLYHVLIEMDGTVSQLADLKAKLRHAGKSRFENRDWCNNFMIGVAFVNPGYLTGTVERAKDIYGYSHFAEDGLMSAESPYHPNGKIWMRPTLEQRQSLVRVIKEIKELLPNVKDITTHYEVSPGRKNDPPPPSVIDVHNIDLGGLDAVGEGLDAAIGCAPVVDHEIMHAVDTRIVTPTTDQELRKSSREYKATNLLKGAAATGGTGAAIFEAASQSNIEGAKAYLDLISSFVSAYSVPIVIGACVTAWGVCELVQHWKRESYDSGRYEPSGEAES